jgi:hypothetical protein
MKKLELNPMSDAPKDGSYIIIAFLFFAELEVRLGHWFGGKWVFTTDTNQVQEIKEPFGWLPLPEAFK